MGCNASKTLQNGLFYYIAVPGRIAIRFCGENVVIIKLHCLARLVSTAISLHPVPHVSISFAFFFFFFLLFKASQYNMFFQPSFHQCNRNIY